MNGRHNRAWEMRQRALEQARTLSNFAVATALPGMEEQLESLCSSDEERICLRCLAIGPMWCNTLFDILTLETA